MTLAGGQSGALLLPLCLGETFAGLRELAAIGPLPCVVDEGLREASAVIEDLLVDLR